MASSSSTGAAWVSSLGNAFGGSSTSSNGNSAPTSTASAFGNPFASANMAAAAAAPSQIGSKEDKNSMMAAFSDMGLALAESSDVDPAAVSSSKALLAKKESERLEEQRAEDARRARRQERARHEAAAAKPASALMQALDAFAGEVSQSDSFSAALHGRASVGAGAFSAGSRRARHKAEKAVARGGKSVRDIKRHQRRDRHVY